MPELYLIGFDAFELRTQGGALTNQELSGGDLIGWNTDAPDGTGQGGGDAAQQWVDNSYTITFTSLGQFYDITDPNGDVEFHDDDADQTLTNDITFGTETYSAGDQIEAEFHIIVEDPVTGRQFTLAGVSFGGSGGDGLLGGTDRGGGLEGDAEIDRFAVTDAALNSAGAVRGGACASVGVRHEGVVMFGARELGSLETRTDLETLGGGQ